MESYGLVIGKVVGREQGGPKSEFLVVEDNSEPDFPKIIACEFYGGQKEQLAKFDPQVGDIVKVEGNLRSNRSMKGKLFTSFNVFRLAKLNHLFPGAAPQKWPEKHREQAAREPGEDSDNGEPKPWF